MLNCLVSIDIIGVGNVNNIKFGFFFINKLINLLSL